MEGDGKVDVVKCSSWFGHRFEAVYTQAETPRGPLPTTIKSSDVDALKVLLNLNRTYYHGHVCIRCGAIVNAVDSK